jgi:hypothetical protein
MVSIRLAAVRAVLPVFYFRTGDGGGVGKQHRLMYAALVTESPGHSWPEGFPTGTGLHNP